MAEPEEGIKLEICRVSKQTNPQRKYTLYL